MAIADAERDTNRADTVNATSLHHRQRKHISVESLNVQESTTEPTHSMQQNLENNRLIAHLQTEDPTMSFEDWYVETVKLFAKAWEIESPAATRRLNIDELEKWYKDGFTPYATFRENFQPLY